MARLDLYRDGKWVRSMAMGQRTYLVGRDPSCDLVVQDPLASRRHFQLAWQSDETFLMTDLQTPNGTQVNGVREFQRKLLAHATLQVGSEMILFDPNVDDDAPPEGDELPAWALSIAEEEDDAIPSTAHIPPADLHRMQANVRARTRPHLLLREGKGTQVFPIDARVTAIGLGPVRISLGSGPKNRVQVLAELHKDSETKIRIKAKGLFGRVVVNGKKKAEAVLSRGDRIEIADVELEFYDGLQGEG